MTAVTSTIGEWRSGVRKAEVAVAAVGAAFMLTALVARQSWLDAHVMPSFFLPHAWYVAIETAVRAALAGVGLLLAWPARRSLARTLSYPPSLLVSAIVAAALALGASEAFLRHVRMRPAEWLLPQEEPLRVADATLGWTFPPTRAARVEIGGRTVEYVIDRSGYRVRSTAEPVDPDRPSLLFVGESIMFGEGLAWDETVPAQVGAMLGLQSANLAVHGFSTDQAYLRLAAELPRFRRAVAVVPLFMTALFGRNLDDDRPHLAPGLVWQPAQPHGRLASLAKLIVPFRREPTVERGVSLTREVLRAAAQLARARGAAPLILVPQFGRESPVERELRRRILDESGVPYAFVEFESGWRLRGDLHPNAAAAHAMAAAIADRLRPIAAATRNPL